MAFPHLLSLISDLYQEDLSTFLLLPLIPIVWGQNFRLVANSDENDRISWDPLQTRVDTITRM